MRTWGAFFGTGIFFQDFEAAGFRGFLWENRSPPVLRAGLVSKPSEDKYSFSEFTVRNFPRATGDEPAARNPDTRAYSAVQFDGHVRGGHRHRERDGGWQLPVRTDGGEETSSRNRLVANRLAALHKGLCVVVSGPISTLFPEFDKFPLALQHRV